ncbi:MAG: cytochrome c [Nonlabens sp.]
MKTMFKFLLATLCIMVLISCGDDTKIVDAKSDRSSQYFPNMYEDVGYSTYSEGAVFMNNMEAQKPVEGTVSRGWMPYDYEDSNEGYASAKAELTNPLPYTEENLTGGQVLYTIYCAICHGTKGDGKGHLVTTEKILGVPSYDSRELTQGSIYHVLYYGINTMGSYASQTSIEERWQIAHHVDRLTRELKKEPAREFESGEAMMTMGDSIMSMGPRDKDSEVEEDALQPGEIEKLKDSTITDGQ